MDLLSLLNKWRLKTVRCRWSEHLTRASFHVVKIALCNNVSSLSTRHCLSTERLRSFHLFFDTHLLFIDHEESVEQHAKSEEGNGVKVDGVLPYFNVIAFPVSLLNVLLVIEQVLLTYGDDWSVPKLLNRSQVYTKQVKLHSTCKQMDLLGRNLLGWTSSMAPGMSVFTLNMERTFVIFSWSFTNSKGMGTPNSST